MSFKVLTEDAFNVLKASIEEVRDEVVTIRGQLDGVVDNLTEILDLQGNLAAVTAVQAKLAEIEAVQGKLTEIEGVFGSLNNLNDLHGALTQLNALHAELAKLLTIEENLAAILNLNSNLTAVNAVNNSLTEIGVTATNIQAIIDAPGFAEAAETQAGVATAAATASQGFRDQSEQFQIVAASYANYVGIWSTLTGALNVPSSVFHDGVFWMLLEDIADVTLSEPDGSNPDWIAIGTAVSSVNGKTGEVVIEIADIDGLGGALTALSEALGDKVDNDDERLDDNREWTASTVEQAEAEAGTATDRRAWTALRVRQAIVAWWDSVKSAYVAVADIVNDFTTGGADKAASAETVKVLNDTKAPVQETDTWVLTTTFAGNADPIASNLARFAHVEKIGIGMTQASGIFTFPRTGIWRIEFIFRSSGGSTTITTGRINVITDASGTPVITSRASEYVNPDGSSLAILNGLEVTDTDDIKVSFTIDTTNNPSTQGNTDTIFTGMIFTRIGDLP